jgi:hypothetical protein
MRTEIIDTINKNKQPECKNGKISVLNEGHFIARFTVNYEFRKNELKKESNRIFEGEQYFISIPGMSQNIKIHVEKLVSGAPEIWKTIFSIGFPYSGNRNFKLWGENISARYGILKPNREKIKN